jgi:hypothetical protein
MHALGHLHGRSLHARGLRHRTAVCDLRNRPLRGAERFLRMRFLAWTSQP